MRTHKNWTKKVATCQGLIAQAASHPPLREPPSNKFEVWLA